MRQVIAKFILSVSPIVLLSGCAHSFNPQTTEYSTREQCITLQRQMLFNSGLSPNESQWSNQVDQQQLQKEFHRLNCYQALEAAKSS